MGEPAVNLPDQDFDLDPINEAGFGLDTPANNNAHFDEPEQEGKVLPFPEVDQTEVNTPTLEPNEGPAFGSADVDAASKAFFDRVNNTVPVQDTLTDNAPGTKSVIDTASIQKAIMAEAKRIAREDLSNSQKREKLNGWVGQLQYNHYLKLRRKAIEGVGDIGLLAEFWNKLDAEEQTEFLTKNNFGILHFAKTMLKNGSAIPGLREAKRTMAYLRRNTAGRVPILRRLVSGLKDWRQEQIAEMVVYGVLDFKGDKSLLKIIEGNMGSIAKVGSWTLTAVASYFGGPLGGVAGKTAGRVSEGSASRIGIIRETIQREAPTPPETPSLVSRAVKAATNKILNRDTQENRSLDKNQNL